MYRIRSSIISSFFLLFWASIAWPQDPEPAPDSDIALPPTDVQAGPLDDLVVSTPTLTESPLAAVASSTTLITAEQIERSGFNLVADVLRTVPGLDIVQTGPRGGLTSVFLRGTNSNQTKVLFNGIPLNDPSSAGRAFDFSSMSVDMIERIEVVRGPQSTLYGSDAIGGVINIITRRGQGPTSVTASFMGGSYGTTRNGGSVSGGNDKLYYAVGGSYFYSDGFSAASMRTGATEADSHRLGTVIGRFGWTPTDQVEIDYVFRWIDARTEIDDASFTIGSPPVDDPTRLNLADSFVTGLKGRWSILDGGITQHLAMSLTDYNRSDLDDVFGTSSFTGQTLLLDYHADLLLFACNTLIVGADHWNESAANSFGDDSSQYKSGVYLQDQWQISDRWSLTVGLRWDEYNRAGAAQTYQIRSVYDVQETGTSFHGTLGTGFRVPSLAENTPPFGNIDLAPEKSRGWDVGVTQRLLDDTMQVEATYFRNDIENLILFDPTVPPFGRLENIGNAKTHGVEVVGIWYLMPDTWLNGTYTRTDTTDLDSGFTLPRRPRDKGTAGITHRFCRCRAETSLYALFVGDRFDARDESVVLDGYTLLNLAGHFDLTDRMQCFYRFDNLLNQQYEEITGFGAASSSAFGGLRMVW